MIESAVLDFLLFLNLLNLPVNNKLLTNNYRA